MSRLTDLIAQVAKTDAALAETFAGKSRFSAAGDRSASTSSGTSPSPSSCRVGRSAAGTRSSSATSGSRDNDVGRCRLRRQGSETAGPARAPRPDRRPGDDTAPIEDLVVVAEFRDPIYPGPGLDRARSSAAATSRSTRSSTARTTTRWRRCSSPTRARSTASTSTRRTTRGAKDWKYNNDYVDGDDAYRHSKWLAFMERRLMLAKELLNPEDSVLIVTIDEKEYLRLGLLLEQMFSGGADPDGQHRHQPARDSRDGDVLAVGRVHLLRAARCGDGRRRADVDYVGRRVRRCRWRTRRAVAGTADAVAERKRAQDRPNQFYPIFVERGRRGRSFGVGSRSLRDDRETGTGADGAACRLADPQGRDREELADHAGRAASAIDEGSSASAASTPSDSATSIYYLHAASIAKHCGRRARGRRAGRRRVADHREYSTRRAIACPTTVWNALVARRGAVRHATARSAAARTDGSRSRSRSTRSRTRSGSSSADKPTPSSSTSSPAPARRPTP